MTRDKDVGDVEFCKGILVHRFFMEVLVGSVVIVGYWAIFVVVVGTIILLNNEILNFWSVIVINLPIQ